MSSIFYPSYQQLSAMSTHSSHHNNHNNNSHNSNNHHHHHNNNHHHHGGRSRRAPRLASLHHSNKHFRPSRAPKEVPEPANVIAFRRDFEAARSFELEDDEMFCPFHLLTEDDVSHPFAHRLLMVPSGC